MNVIPGRVVLTTDIRHPEDPRLTEAIGAVAAAAARIAGERGVAISSAELSGDPSVPCNARLRLCCRTRSRGGLPGPRPGERRRPRRRRAGAHLPGGNAVPPLRGRHVAQPGRERRRARRRHRARRHGARHPRPGASAVSDRVRITSGEFAFTGRLERDRAPRTCEAFEGLLPYEQRVIHVRWSRRVVLDPARRLRPRRTVQEEAPPATRRRASSSGTRAASPRRSCSSRTATAASRRRPASSPATTS